jgi:hypothetical protein
MSKVDIEARERMLAEDELRHAIDEVRRLEKRIKKMVGSAKARGDTEALARLKGLREWIGDGA